MSAVPIAIVGQSCLLPGASSPEQLWELVESQRDEISAVPQGRWRISPAQVVCDPAGPKLDATWSDRGSYVRGFDKLFDADGFDVPAEELLALDPLFQWVLHTAREALRDSKHVGDTRRVGAVFGNLSYPSASLSRFAESVWLGSSERPDPRNRFSSGLPALLLERAMGLGGGCFALDAACASSLYAIKIACDWLSEGSRDLVLAGAANCADDLFIHVGFTALQALSKTGQSRPFHAAADGLVPAEGAGFVALKRLADAEECGDRILGVVRGVGLSNDGRGKGFLVPSAEGQARAMRAALSQSGLRPSDISLMECHATGTTLGDATELDSLARVYERGQEPLPIGSLKSNLGHLITAAGVAGLIKVLEAMRHGTRPATLHVEEPTPALDGAPFRLLARAEPWEVEGPRRAAVSAFGFGGNNAHLIVEEHLPRRAPSPAPTATARDAVAIVGLGVTAAGASGRAAFTDALFSGDCHLGDGPDGQPQGRAANLEVDLLALGIPPKDLDQTLAQQLLVLDAGREAAAEVSALPRETTGVYVGMGVDMEVARYGARWRHGGGFVDALTAAGVIGAMPNMAANRLNRQLDLGGASATVSAEEASGLVALDLAVRGLQRGDLDAALVGAVDLSCEPAHQAAADACLPGARRTPGDAAVVLVLKRLSDAQQAGDRVYAVVDETGAIDAEAALSAGAMQWDPDEPGLTRRFGYAHAASGLLHVAAAVLSLHHRRHPDGRPWLSQAPRRAEVRVRPMDGNGAQHCGLVECVAAPARREGASPALHLFQGADEQEVLAALSAGTSSPLDGPAAPARLVIITDSESQLRQRVERARAHITSGAPAGVGVHYRAVPVSGDLAFVFTSAGSAYQGMGQQLLLDLPELGDALSRRFDGLGEAMQWVYASKDGSADATERLWAASALSQVHAELSLGRLGLKPQAALGYSSGESSSLFAFGAWQDMDAMREDCASSGLFDRELGGKFDVIKRRHGANASWAMWSVLAPQDEVHAALQSEPNVHLAIVHTSSDSVIGGEAEATARVVELLGAARCRALDYNVTVHVPELDDQRQQWLAVHRRETFDVPGVRFYSGGFDAAYSPESELCAQAILGQANRCLDFPKMVETAWSDGIRIFVEHGPGGSCSRWIRDILGPERLLDAVVAPLDRRGSGVDQVLAAVAALLAAGVEIDSQPLLERLATAVPKPRAKSPTTVRRIPAHPAPVLRPSERLPDDGNQIMEPAPPLPPVLDAEFVVAHHAPDAAPVLTDAAAPARAAAPSTPDAARAAHAAAPRMSRAAESPGMPIANSQASSPFAFLAQIHTQFLQQQAEVHQRFLATQSRLQGMALGMPQAPAVAPAIARTGTPAPTQKWVETPTPTPTPTGTPTPTPTGTGTRTPTLTHAPAPTHTPAPPPTLANAPKYALSAPTPTGPTFNRAQLEVDASGKISEIFGPLFVQQDGFERQVRMPEPPLLLADRVTGIDAEAGAAGKGAIWTETDVLADSWYLNQGRMPAGIFIESGQADLMLISWMGADFLNKGERVYRLLGCTLTYEGDLPAPGETLTYDIHVDGHARHEDVRLFFFHYDCRIDGDVRLAVRNGQAGFFSEEELAQSEGIVWTPEGAEISQSPRLEAPDQLSERRRFTKGQVEAFAAGRAWDCFGTGFEYSHTHTQSARIQTGRMLLLDEVSEFSPGGGPWGRGYLKARTQINSDDWYFDGHFKNDPCMPGTLMFEGCVQALSFYLAALGYTLKRDAWVFKPVPGEPIEMQCRGQVTPESSELIYEVFVQEIIAGPEPTIYADLLCTVDGLKAFHAKRVGWRLAPDWPLESHPELLADHTEPKPAAIALSPDGEQFTFGYESLLSCAWGKPSKAFPIYRVFDGHRRGARLPGPPYHFMSRILSVSGKMGEPKAGAEVVAEYDVPADAWYFDENGHRTMPYAVLLEAALQPCGWLASYVGCALTVDTDLLFRNLDGTGTQHTEILDNAGALRTEAKLTSVSNSSGMIIVSFDVQVHQASTLVYDMKTVFGFFPSSAFDDQAGLPVSNEQRALLEAPSDIQVDLDDRPDAFYRGGACLPGSKLDMLNRITGFWPEGGRAGLGSMRAVKDVHASDWYFKAHFFQDPVQPGSLGIEALIQLLQCHMLQTGMAEGIVNPRFEPIATGVPMTWKYRGQVVPRNKSVTSVIEITDRGRDDLGAFAICDASLWVDGIRIYSASKLGMRILSAARASKSALDGGLLLDPARDSWLRDHCPTWNRPALPLMSMVDLLAGAVEGSVTGLKDVRVLGWVDFPGPRRLHTTIEQRAEQQHVTLWSTPADDLGGEPTKVASARVVMGEYAPPPDALPSVDGRQLESPYASGALFHGPAFHLLESGTRSNAGVSSLLNAGAGDVPQGTLHPALLDAALHGIPHDRLHIWSAEIAEDKVGYPARILELEVFGPTPTSGEVRCEVRFDGFLVAPDLPRFLVQLIADGRVWVQLRLVEACFPKGRLGAAVAEERRAFLQQHCFVPGLRLSRQTSGETRLSQAEVDASDWMPGTMAGIYRATDAEDIARLEHVAAREAIHPARLPEALPLNPPNVSVTRDGDDVVVRDAQSRGNNLDPTPLRPFWDEALGVAEPWLGRDLWEGLLRRYVRRVVVVDPVSFDSLKSRSALFLGNHQVQIESLLITNILSGLRRQPVVTMANAKHEQRWIGWILRHMFTHPGCKDPRSILYFDQDRPESMFEILNSLKPDLAAGRRSFFLHPQGTRSRSCRDATTKLSSTFLDLALELDLPIVPVRFVGGLPVAPVEGKLDFPYGHAAQDYFIGSVIEASELRALPYAKRAKRVLEAMASLSGPPDLENPFSPDPSFARSVAEWQAQTKTSEVEAVFFRVLEQIDDPSAETKDLLRRVSREAPTLQATPTGHWLAHLAARLSGSVE